MIELRLDSDDSFASIGKGGPGCITGPHEKFPLESLLESIAGYQIKDIDTGMVHIDEDQPFHSPLLILYNKEKEEHAVLLRKDSPNGTTMYYVYPYEPEMLGDDSEI